MNQLAISIFGVAPIFGSGVLYGLFVVHHFACAEHDNKVTRAFGAFLLGLLVIGIAAYFLGGVSLIKSFAVLGPISIFAGFAARYGVTRMISEQYRLSSKTLNKLSAVGVNDGEWQRNWGKHGPLVIIVFGGLCAILALKLHFDDLFGMPGEPSGINFWHYFGLIYPSVMLGVPALRKAIRDWAAEYFFVALFTLSAASLLAFFSLLKILFFS